MKKGLLVHVVVRQSGLFSNDEQVTFSFPKRCKLSLYVAQFGSKRQTRVAPRQLTYDRRDKSSGHYFGATHAHFAAAWVRKKFDLIDALPEFVEHRDTAPEESSTVECRLDASRCAVGQWNSEGVL